MSPRHLPKLRAVGLFAALACFIAPAAAQGLPPATLTLTNAAQVRSLSASEAAAALPVHLRGVILDEAYPPGRALIIHDGTSGIYLLADKNIFATYKRGDLVDAEGVTDPGQFAPIVRVTRAQRTGTGAEPIPRKVTYQELISGAMDAQWVEVVGVVRRCVEQAPPDIDAWRVVVNVGGGNLSVRLPMPRDPLIQEDAEVRLHGICLYEFNQKRQALNPVLQVPLGVPVQIDKLAPANPFSAPVRSTADLQLFTPERASGHRIHVRGVVTYSQPESFVWIRDQASGLRVQTFQPGKLQPGDVIDVLGFPTYRYSSFTLENSIYRKTGSGKPVLPVTFTNSTEAFDLEDDLVSTTAKLTDVQPMLKGMGFTLELAGTVFKADLDLPPNQRMPAQWQAGSLVRITGICSVVHDEVRPMMGMWHPQTFQIQLRSPGDLAVLVPPPWWTPGHIIQLLAAVIGGLFLITGLVAMMAQHRLKEQARHRAMAEAEFAAILSERNRMAREIHDTLAQGLAATSIQLRLAKRKAEDTQEALHQHLDAAQQLVRESLNEARNSIWNMRSQVLETSDLPSALRNILKQMADGAGLKATFECTGRVRRLATLIENNCLRVGQEAITNAAKHAQAKEIKVRLEYEEKFLRLLVTDDGLGFDPVNPPPSKSGFGLVGIRERAATLKATLDIHRAPNQGTEISLSIPLVGD